MLRFNEEKVFADSVDDQLVALVIETGSYYTFNQAATAAINDFTAGYEIDEVAQALASLADDAPAKLAAFVKSLVEKGIMEEDGSGTPEDRPAMACAALSVPAEGLTFEMDGYDDVAAYFMIDPIHEVDPDMGWPVLPQD